MSVFELVATHVLSLLAGVAGGVLLFWVMHNRRRAPVKRLLQRHFGPATLDSLVITGRKFHARIRADLQTAIDRFFVSGTAIDFSCGLRQEHPYFGCGFSELLAEEGSTLPVAMEHEDVDIGDEAPVRCAVNGLWLLTNEGSKYAVLMSSTRLPGETPLLHFQVAAKSGAASGAFCERFFGELEETVREAASYRGKVLSLEDESLYSGQFTGVTVNKLRSVGREEVILPPKTLELLDRNVIRFVHHRPALAKVGQTTKKGLLFYGPPGNGKTHTIHYLAQALEGHTILLITGGQMGLLSEYMTLARLLQPSVVVIEDVDLIARQRTDMDSPCQESLLNRLLNEMDGLAPQADILFILTTNRPSELEQALAARPGRVDQAVEFPLPDEDGRRKLARLYSRGIAVSDDVLTAVVAKTQRTSAAFIKELMRRSLLNHLERDAQPAIDLQDIDDSLEELLQSGGALNRKLLGAGDGQIQYFQAGLPKQSDG